MNPTPWPADESPGRAPVWSEAPSDEPLRPGDLGGGTEDLEAASELGPRRTRRVPVSFSSVVLLLTITVGMGMAAGLLAGPIPGQLPNGPGLGGPSSGSGPPSGAIPPTNITPPPPNPNGSGGAGGNGSQTGGGGGPGNGSGSSGGNGSGSSGGNGSSGGGSGGGQSGGSGGGNGSGGGGPSGPGRNRTVSVYRATLPWLPTDGRLLLIAGVTASLGALALAVLYESYRPPPPSGNPWIGRSAPRRPRRPPAARVSARERIESAVEALRAELVRYGRSTYVPDREVRERVIALYGALLAAVAPGLGRLEMRTPREVEWLSVRYLGVRPETAHELTWLFEEARYSTHRLPPTAVSRGVSALSALVDDLQRRAWEL